MHPTSIKLFGAWSARHKEIIALEDAVAEAREAGQDVAAMESRLLALRADAEKKLQAARDRFREEIRERGLAQ